MHLVGLVLRFLLLLPRFSFLYRNRAATCRFVLLQLQSALRRCIRLQLRMEACSSMRLLLAVSLPVPPSFLPCAAAPLSCKAAGLGARFLPRGRNGLGALVAILYPDASSEKSIADGPGAADLRGGDAEATAVAEGVARGKLAIDPSGVVDASDGADGNSSDVKQIGAPATLSRREERRQ